ncbi:MAG: NAD-dependent epimerase/dehydratase family protein [Deltaproteobacteria bacterium]|nr:NAD-dependent epimerase/dehydratase family protein [Deltaproteobacteria bacterium]
MPYDPEGAVLVTGIAGRLGRLVASRLHREVQVVGLDRRPFPGRPKDVKHYQIDIRRKKVEELFERERIRAVVHMAIVHDPRLDAEEHHSVNVIGTRRVLDLVLKHGVRKVVVLSSATVYGPRADNTQFITEDTPLLGAERHGDLRDLVQVDLYANTFLWKQPEVETVVLRPVHIVGDVGSPASNYLRLPRFPVVMGFDPMIQVIHAEDVVAAMMASLRPGVRGVFNVVGPDGIPLSRLLREIGRPLVPIPGPLLTAGLFCMVDGERFARDVGFRPRLSLRDVIAVYRDAAAQPARARR